MPEQVPHLLDEVALALLDAEQPQRDDQITIASAAVSVTYAGCPWVAKSPITAAESGGGGHRAHDQVPRAAEHRAHYERGSRGVEPDHVGTPGIEA